MRAIRLKPRRRVWKRVASIESITVAGAGCGTRSDAGEIAAGFRLELEWIGTLEQHLNRGAIGSPDPKVDSSSGLRLRTDWKAAQEAGRFGNFGC
jgi:hypothetical protein